MRHDVYYTFGKNIMSIKRTSLLICPHCGNETQHNLVLEHTFEPEWYGSDGQLSDDPPVPMSHLAFVCTTCDDLSLYCIIDGHEETMKLEYPHSHILDICVPKAVRKNYAEARSLQKRSPNAFAVLIRRSLEALCDDKKVKKGILGARLKELAEQGIIPPTLAEMSTALRLLGNAGAHHNEENITIPQTWKIDKLFLAIIEYVYIGPKLLSDFKKTAKQEKT